MRFLLSMILLFAMYGTSGAAINLAVSQQSGKAVQERAGQLADQLSRTLGTPVKVVALADAGEVAAWLNRYATAELALVEAAYAAGRPGQFVVIGPVGRDLVLVGRQGIGGDLPRKAAGAIGGGMERPAASSAPMSAPVTAPVAAAAPALTPAAPAAAAVPTDSFSASKSASEDRYFVIQTYREKFGRDPEPERLEYWTEQLQNGALSKRQFSEQVCQQGLALCEKTQ